MSIEPCSLNTLYKQKLCSLNPLLPHLIEHLVRNAILSRTEASKIVAMSDQFNRLTQLLAEKGTQNKDAVLIEIESFRQDQRKKKEEDKKESGRCHSQEASAQLLQKHNAIEGVCERNDQEKTGDRKRRDKRLKTVLPRGIDLVSDVGSNRGDTQRKTSGMDPFFTVFYTFLTQLLTSDDDGLSHDRSCDPSHTPLIPAWIKVDLTCDQVLAYFPSSFRKSIKSGSHGDNDRHGDYDRHRKLETVPLSQLMSNFKCFVKQFDVEVRERKLLAGKVKLVEGLTARNQHLEEEVWELRKKSTSHSALETSTSTSAVNYTTTKEDSATISHLRKMLSKAELNLKELSAINNQWSLESQEKASEIKVLKIQLKDALEEVRCLQVRLRQAEENARKSKTKDKEVKETEIIKENNALKTELAEMRRVRERDQDEISELKDRIGNLRVQAQSKLPSVKEMTQLSSENRQLRETVKQDKLKIEALQNQLQDLKNEIQCYIQHGTEFNSTKGHHHGDTSIITNKSEILVDTLPTDKDQLTCLHDIQDPSLTTIELKQAPLYFDINPLTPHKSTAPKETLLLNGINTETETKNHTCIPMTSSGKPMTSSSTRITRSPPPPNQPEATIVAGMRLTANEGRQCPVCSTTFMMLGEREFQCHVAGCHRPTS